jgi:hypothetical protein
MRRSPIRLLAAVAISVTGLMGVGAGVANAADVTNVCTTSDVICPPTQFMALNADIASYTPGFVKTTSAALAALAESLWNYVPSLGSVDPYCPSYLTFQALHTFTGSSIVGLSEPTAAVEAILAQTAAIIDGYPPSPC